MSAPKTIRSLTNTPSTTTTTNTLEKRKATVPLSSHRANEHDASAKRVATSNGSKSNSSVRSKTRISEDDDDNDQQDEHASIPQLEDGTQPRTFEGNIEEESNPFVEPTPTPIPPKRTQTTLTPSIRPRAHLTETTPPPPVISEPVEEKKENQTTTTAVITPSVSEPIPTPISQAYVTTASQPIEMDTSSSSNTVVLDSSPLSKIFKGQYWKNVIPNCISAIPNKITIGTKKGQKNLNIGYNRRSTNVLMILPPLLVSKYYGPGTLGTYNQPPGSNPYKYLGGHEETHENNLKMTDITKAKIWLQCNCTYDDVGQETLEWNNSWLPAAELTYTKSCYEVYLNDSTVLPDWLKIHFNATMGQCIRTELTMLQEFSKRNDEEATKTLADIKQKLLNRTRYNGKVPLSFDSVSYIDLPLELQQKIDTTVVQNTYETKFARTIHVIDKNKDSNSNDSSSGEKLYTTTFRAPLIDYQQNKEDGTYGFQELEVSDLHGNLIHMMKPEAELPYGTIVRPKVWMMGNANQKGFLSLNLRLKGYIIVSESTVSHLSLADMIQKAKLEFKIEPHQPLLLANSAKEKKMAYVIKKEPIEEEKKSWEQIKQKVALLKDNYRRNPLTIQQNPGLQAAAERDPTLILLPPLSNPQLLLNGAVGNGGGAVVDNSSSGPTGLMMIEEMTDAQVREAMGE